MNYMPHIINYMSKRDDIVEIYMAPKSAPVEKREGVLVRILDTVFTPEDVRDTLVAFKSHTPHALGPLGREGSFSFGLHGVGRFRVTYITQRGSYVVHMVKTPYDVPNLRDLCDGTSPVARIEELMIKSHAGIIPILGKNTVKTASFAYSLLQEICSNYSKIVFVLESPLSFLLKHGKSLVIQREVGMDVDNFDEGLRDALLINPDIVYLGFRDFLPTSETTKFIRLVEINTVVMVQLPYASVKQLLDEFNIEKEFLRGVVLVSDSEKERGKLKIEFIELQHRVEESR